MRLRHGHLCVPECVCRNPERIHQQGVRGRGRETIRFVLRYQGHAPGDDFIRALSVGDERDPSDRPLDEIRAPSPPPTYEEASKTSPPQLLAAAAALEHSDGSFPPPEYDAASEIMVRARRRTSPTMTTFMMYVDEVD